MQAMREIYIAESRTASVGCAEVRSASIAVNDALRKKTLSAVGWAEEREPQQLGHCGIACCGSRKNTLSPTYRA
jgi:hypothetical protein